MKKETKSKCHLQNEEYYKILISRGKCISLALIISLISTFVFNSCNNEIKDDNSKIPEYIGIINFGEQFDFAILGKDGLGYFYDFQDEKPIPERLTIYDGNKREVKMVFNFDEEGLPKNILSEEFTIVLGNYEENRFDAVVITKNGDSHILENIETHISWDEYKNDLLSGVQSSTIVLRSAIGKWINKNIVKPVIKTVNTISSAVACGAGIGISTTGVGAIVGVPLAAYGCTNMVINGLELFDDLGIIDYESPQFIEDIRNYGGDLFQKCIMALSDPNPLSVLSCAGEIIKNAADNHENAATDEIRLGEGMLETGNGVVKITLIWDNYADIDLHCIDPAGDHIYYANMYSSTGGFLDYDNTEAYGPENIYFNPAPAGTYRVFIHYFAENYGIRSVNYMVAVFQNNSGQVYEGTISGEDSVVEIATFTYGTTSRSNTNTNKEDTDIDWSNLPEKIRNNTLNIK